jgi:hypothetical protein
VGLYYGGRQIKDLKIFFWVSTVLLLLVAAGQVNLGTWNFITAGVQAGRISPFLNQRPWAFKPAFDATACCSTANHASNKFFPLMRAIFGYSDKPSPTELLVYFGYWLVVIGMFVFKWQRGSLFDADYKHKQQHGREEEDSSSDADVEAKGSNQDLPAAKITADADQKDVVSADHTALKV